MNEAESRYLDAFASWLKALKTDALSCARLLDEETSAPVREHLASGLSYLFKSLDLIPDGIEDLGFIDDAFVLRVSAALALESAEARDVEALAPLAEEARLVRDFLGPDYARLEAFTRSLTRLTVRGRSVAAVVSDPEARRELIDDVKAWSSSYQTPTFTRDEKNLVKLRAFLGAKLPS